MKKNVIALMILFSLTGCSVVYVMKQGYHQAKLLIDAQPISMVLRSTSLTDRFRQQLMLITDVRQFAIVELGLNGDKNYKDVSLNWHGSVHTVMASEPLRLKPYLWWFPVIGSVPYKGFFDEGDADAEEKRLKDLGFDTLKNRVSGYSTLGFFSDPVWPSMLNLRDEALIELIIHELAHATIYIKGQASFNETLANFVGKRGAIMFAKSRYGGGSEEIARLKNYQEQQVRHRDFFHRLYEQLNEVYESDMPAEEKVTKKTALIKAAEKQYLSSLLGDLIEIDWARVNNAYLITFKTYNHDDAVFDKLLAKARGDFKDFIHQVRLRADGEQPFASLAKSLPEDA